MKLRPEKVFSTPVSGCLIYGNEPAIEDYIAEKLLPLKIQANSEEVKVFEEAELLQISKEKLYLESGLFSAPKLYVVRNVTDKFLPLLESYAQNVPLVLIGKNLRAKNKIVMYINQHSKYSAVPIYDNDVAFISAFVQHELADYSLEPGVHNMLVSSSLSFLQLQQCIKNIQQAYSPSSAVSVKVIDSLLPQAFSSTLFNVADVFLSKNAGELMRVFYSSSDVLDKEPIPLVRVLSKQMWSLAELLKTINAGASPDQAITRSSPPIHFKRKPLMISALSRWTLLGCLRAIVALDELEVDLKKNKAATLDFLERSLVQMLKL